MKILTRKEAQPYQNTSLKRGHVVFTSLIQYDSKILFLESHLKRLLRGADFLFPQEQWKEKQGEIASVVKNELADKKNHYLRLTIFDDQLVLETHLRENYSDNVKLTEALSRKTPDLKPSFLKKSCYLQADLELRQASEDGFDEILFLSYNNELTEASTSNIFVVTDENVIKTPPASSMVLEGITREKLSECLRRNNFKVFEETLTRSDIEKASEIWLTNAVKGIRFVSQFQNKNFSATGSVYEKVLTLFGRYGEKYE